MTDAIFRRIAAGLILLFALPLQAAPVAVIQGKEALPPAEHRFAQSLANHAERWLKDAGVEVARSDDTALETALANKKVAVLAYPGTPTPRQMAALQAFTGRGGRLIVCYSSSPALAALMGVRPLGYRKGSTDGTWSRMRLLANRPEGAPELVAQTSSNLFAVEPVAGRSAVMAWWEDRQGKQTADAAWLVSPQGWWFTHVLLADGDADAKATLLLAMAASVDPALWPAAARRRLKQADDLFGPQGLAALAAKIDRCRDTRRAQAARTAYEKLRQIQTRAQTDLAAGRAARAWVTAGEIQSRIHEIYGMIQSPRRGEIRAVWEHSGQGLYPGDWPRTCRLLKDAGITDLYVNVAGSSFAHYPSTILPRSRVCLEQGDQLATCLAAAKPLGLRVHAWLLCFGTEQATAERLAIFHQRGWLLTKDDGSPRPWLDPAVPAARAYLVSAVREMAAGYAVDGIHLDFVRYPDFPGSLGPSVRNRYETFRRKRLADWPACVLAGGAERAAFIRWRAEQVTDFVEAARHAVKQAAPGRLVTAAVYGKHPSCVDAVGQDWESWLRLGLLDYVMPMNYTEDPATFNAWLANQTRTRQQAMKIVPGIGVTAAESRLNPIQIIDQINAARRAGCPGFALFDLDTTLRQEVLPVLRVGIAAP